LGKIEIIGAVSSLKVGYYNQDEKQYTTALEITKKLEINACIGNISIKDGKPFAHLHITCSDHDGNTVGGHLMPGAVVFAAEAIITECQGDELIRQTDAETGLPLWAE